MFLFRKIWRALFSCNTHFRFALLPYRGRIIKLTTISSLAALLFERYHKQRARRVSLRLNFVADKTKYSLTQNSIPI